MLNSSKEKTGNQPEPLYVVLYKLIPNQNQETEALQKQTRIEPILKLPKIYPTIPMSELRRIKKVKKLSPLAIWINWISHIALSNSKGASKSLLPQVDFSEVLLEINAKTGFMKEFTHLNESFAKV